MAPSRCAPRPSAIDLPVSRCQDSAIATGMPRSVVRSRTCRPRRLASHRAWIRRRKGLSNGRRSKAGRRTRLYHQSAQASRSTSSSRPWRMASSSVLPDAHPLESAMQKVFSPSSLGQGVSVVEVAVARRQPAALAMSQRPRRRPVDRATVIEPFRHPVEARVTRVPVLAIVVLAFAEVQAGGRMRRALGDLRPACPAARLVTGVAAQIAFHRLGEAAHPRLGLAHPLAGGAARLPEQAVVPRVGLQGLGLPRPEDRQAVARRAVVEIGNDPGQRAHIALQAPHHLGGRD